jgi:hypothetical protein
MSESERRFHRYALAPGAFSRQRVRALGFIGFFKSWKECRVKDMSIAGALLLTKQQHILGDKVEVELQTVEGVSMIFLGEVVNLGMDHSTDQHRVGVHIDPPRQGTPESLFLESLPTRFKASY